MKEKDVLLVLGENGSISKTSRVLKDVEKGSKKICYVTLERPAHDIIHDFKKKGIGHRKFKFIDAVSTDTGRNIINVLSITNLAEIKYSIENLIGRKEADVLVFDNLSEMLRKMERKFVKDFFKALKHILDNAGAKSIFLIKKREFDPDIFIWAGMSVDRVIGSPEIERLDYGSLNKDLNKLMDKLFGPDARKVIENHNKDVTPDVYIRHWRKMMSVMVGPENTDKQLSYILEKYFGDK